MSISARKTRVMPLRAAILGFASLLSVTRLSFGAVLTTNAEIHHAIIGNTISGTEDGKPYAEYYQPDGYIHGQEPEGSYVGEWRIAGRNVCVRYFDRGEGPDRDENGSGSIGAWECMGVDIQGSLFAWIKDANATRPSLSREIRTKCSIAAALAGRLGRMALNVGLAGLNPTPRERSSFHQSSRVPGEKSCRSR
jgi:hypothetical protein